MLGCMKEIYGTIGSALTGVSLLSYFLRVELHRSFCRSFKLFIFGKFGCATCPVYLSVVCMLSLFLTLSLSVFKPRLARNDLTVFWISFEVLSVIEEALCCGTMLFYANNDSSLEFLTVWLLCWVSRVSKEFPWTIEQSFNFEEKLVIVCERRMPWSYISTLTKTDMI